jgi:hypothetical protein
MIIKVVPLFTHDILIIIYEFLIVFLILSESLSKNHINLSESNHKFLIILACSIKYLNNVKLYKIVK